MDITRLMFISNLLKIFVAKDVISIISYRFRCKINIARYE